MHVIHNVTCLNVQGPGGWNDPDMLLGSTPGAMYLLQPAQSRSQFNLWVIMAAPLLIGTQLGVGVVKSIYLSLSLSFSFSLSLSLSLSLSFSFSLLLSLFLFLLSLSLRTTVSLWNSRWSRLFLLEYWHVQPNQRTILRVSLRLCTYTHTHLTAFICTRATTVFQAPESALASHHPFVMTSVARFQG
jgi:hypothetical protein